MFNFKNSKKNQNSIALVTISLVILFRATVAVGSSNILRFLNLVKSKILFREPELLATYCGDITRKILKKGLSHNIITLWDNDTSCIMSEKSFLLSEQKKEFNKLLKLWVVL